MRHRPQLLSTSFPHMVHFCVCHNFVSYLTFPDPVFALTMQLSPALSFGMAAACTFDARARLIDARPLNTALSKPI